MSTQKQYDLAVVIGRFQPLHNGHERNIHIARELADNVLVLVGSAFQPRTPKNPFTYEERKSLIYNVFLKNTYQLNPAFNIQPLRDYLYEDTKWVAQVQQEIGNALIQNNLPNNAKVCIVGHDKDESTWYLRMFSIYSYYDTGSFVEDGENPINATQLRELMFEGNYTLLKGVVHPDTYKWLTTEFFNSDSYRIIKEEYDYIKAYKKAWSVAPFPPTFNTVDAVVLQGGHVLLVQRGDSPGKGLWALPGGFLNPNETCIDGMIRELREETCLKVPEPVLRGSVTHKQRFDHPDRSLRGRTITEAFLIELTDQKNGKLPRVKGDDDAVDAKWFPLSQIYNMSEQLFEDHHSIISMLTARAR